MNINGILLNNFRNYERQFVSLKKGVNVFFGNNAQGKTNLLEAIFICSIGKSFRTNRDRELIRFDSDKMNIDISFGKSDRSGKISLELGEKKIFSLKVKLVKKTLNL